jgi:hypothetical protein
MRIIKIIAGCGCFFAALLSGLLGLISIEWVGISLAIIPAFFAWCLVFIGLVLIMKRRSPLSKWSKVLIFLFVAVVIASPIILDLHIRHERTVLQKRAKEFLLRPIPKLLFPDSEGKVGGYYVDTNAGLQNGVFGYSQILIERYATKGRIRWSAVIQGEFAITGEGVNPNFNSNTINTNEEVRVYMAERNAILAKEWQMGFWQCVEDTMEFKSTIPEFEEEDQDDRYVQQLDGTWTNKIFGTMSISPDGRFSAILPSQSHTNIFKGTQFFRFRDSVLVVFTDTRPPPNAEEKDIKIIHVDSHNLVYEFDDETNSMSR